MEIGLSTLKWISIANAKCKWARFAKTHQGDVEANEYGIRKMHTKWGTCNTEAKRIWLNLELAKKPVECLEFIIVHELVHVLERSHNEAFVNYMNQFMPKWRFYREELNKLPFSHLEWKY